jgi:serpin B
MHSLFKGVMIVLCLAFANSSPVPLCPSISPSQAQKSQQALTEFAINLFKNVSSQDESKNQAVSPLSIALGLALLESGASGKTRQEIQHILLEARSSSSEDVLNVYVNLEEELKIKGRDTQLTVVNGLFKDNDLKLKDDFLSLIKNCFKSEVDQVDFKEQLEQARQKVNRFVSQKTQQKITELFKRGDLNTDDRLVLANAVYFKASWKQSFNKKQTKKDTFYRDGRDEQEVEFLQQSANLRHVDNDDLTALELPYENEDLNMLVVLPKSRDGLRDLEKKLNGQKLRDIVSKLEKKKVDVQLPKFQVRSHFGLKELLTKLGLKTLFTQDADLSRMSETPLKIDSGVHEAYVSVDENGTEGAAATGFSIENKALPMPPQEQVTFKADHPFLYAVVHKQTGAIVFLGKVNSIDKQ